MESYDTASFLKEMGHVFKQLQQSAYDDGAFNLAMRFDKIASEFHQLWVDYFALHVKK